jgi:hypothetical protein
VILYRVRLGSATCIFFFGRVGFRVFWDCAGLRGGMERKGNDLSSSLS